MESTNTGPQFSWGDVEEWARRGLISQDQLAAISAELASKQAAASEVSQPAPMREERPGLNLVTIAYYFGGFLALLGYTVFLGTRWSSLSYGMQLLAMAVTMALLLALVHRVIVVLHTAERDELAAEHEVAAVVPGRGLLDGQDVAARGRVDTVREQWLTDERFTAVEVMVAADAERIHGEPECGATVAVRIDYEMHPVGVNPARITSRELRRDLIWIRVEHSDAYVERRVIVQNSCFGLVGRSLVGFGIRLYESGKRLRRLPRCLVKLTVERDVAVAARCRRDSSLSCVDCWSWRGSGGRRLRGER